MHKLASIVLSLVSVAVVSKRNAATHRDLNFLAIGDWGGEETSPYTTKGELAIAKSMAALGDEPEFVVALGDNFYYEGVKSVDDPRFEETFEGVFTDPALQVPWYVIAGNHDWNGNVSAQIAYSDVSPRWNFPALYHTFTKNFTDASGAAVSVQFVLIDTVQLAGQTFDYIPGPPTKMFAELLDPAKADEQLQWIEDTLSSSTADWVVVGGHFPVLSIAEHGPTPALVSRLRPLLAKHGAVAYLCGHDHNLQYLREDRAAASAGADVTPPAADSPTMDYILTGAAHLVDYSQAHKSDVPQRVSSFFWPQESDQDAVSGYTALTVNSTTFTVRYLDADNRPLLRVDLPNPRAT